MAKDIIFFLSVIKAVTFFKNRIIISTLNISLKLRPKPIALRLPKASVFVTFENWEDFVWKQPLTVSVSKPNSFLKINNKESYWNNRDSDYELNQDYEKQF